MDRVWYEHYDKGVPQAIDPDKYNSLMELFDYSIEKFGDQVAFTNFDVPLTYRELDEKSRCLAAYFQQAWSLKKGDRIALMMPNLLQYPIALFAALRAGLVVVNINPLYTARELLYQLKDSGAKAIIVIENYAHTLENVIAQTGVEHVMISQIGGMLGFKGHIINFVIKYIKKMVPDFNIKNAVLFKKCLKEGKKLKFQPVNLTGEDLAFLQYTGGTTGLAKGAMLTHRNLLANIAQALAWIASALDPKEDIALGALPLYHIFSLMVCCFTFLSLGVQCLLVTNPRDFKGFIKILSKTPVSVFIGLNTLLNAMINHPDVNKADFSKLKLTIAGGMAMQHSVAEEWEKLTGDCVLEAYGLTETSPAVSINPLSTTKFTGSIGLPIPSTDVVIRDDQGNDLPFGEVGELCVKGPQVMRGYWNKPEETHHVLSEDGWLRTGDIAKIDEKGFIYIVDRKKDMILVSGFNVYPNEVEQVIAEMPEIAEVAVIGVENASTGEAVKAFIVKKDGINLTEEKVKAHCRESLTAYKIPKLFEFRDELPKTNVGKVLRRELRENK